MTNANTKEVEDKKELFTKYINEVCNKEELNEFLNWVKDENNSCFLSEYIADDWDRQVIGNSPLKPPVGGFEKLLHRLENERSRRGDILKRKSYSNRIKPGKTALRIAASIGIPIAIGFSAYRIGSNVKGSSTTAINTVTAPIGSKSKVELSDGSIIWLNSGSTLEYPSTFTEKNRTVKLSGEGYFEVAKNEESPFIVKTSDIDVTVLGTKFNLKSYPGEETIETMLIEGKVLISKSNEDKNNRKFIELKPNEKAVFVKKADRVTYDSISGLSENKLDKNIQKETKRNEQLLLSEIEDVEPYTAWKDEKLVFQNKNFEEVCVLMERWYNVEINLCGEELKKHHYTGTLENENIIDAIKAFQLTLSFRYKINHNIIDIWADNNNIENLN